MNKWLYRAAGALGVASGTLLLSGGVAHADATLSVDPEAMRAGVADFFTPAGPHFVPAAGREEFIGGLLGGGGRSPLSGLTGGLGGGGGSPLSGLTGGLGGLTGGKDGNNLLNGLTGGGDLLGSVTGTVANGADPLSNLTGGLDDGDSPLSSLTGGLTDGGGPLTKVTGDPASGDNVAGAVTSRLTGKLFGSGEGQGGQALDPMTDDVVTPDHRTAPTLGPVSNDLIDPAMRGTSADTKAQQGIQLDPATARQVNNVTTPMVSAMIADAIAKQMGTTTDDLLSGPALPDITGPAQDLLSGQSTADARAVADVFDQITAEVPDRMGTDASGPARAEESFPLVDQLPVAGTMLGGGGPLGQVVAVGDIHRGIPLVGPALDGQFSVDSITQLPVVGNLINNGMLKTGDGPGLPVVGSLPFIGGALKNMGKQTTTPAPSAMQPPPGAAAKPPTPTMPTSAAQAPLAPAPNALGRTPAAQPAPAASTTPNRTKVTQAPIHAGRHRATERPELIDPDYLESGEPPALDPPTSGDLPLVGPPLKQLPLVGGLL